MNEKITSYEKSTHITKIFHKKLKNRANEKDSTIRQELNNILKKEFKDEKK